MWEKMMKKITRRGYFRTINNKDINMAELSNIKKKGAVLIDVRSPQEFAEGHLEGAILLPDYEVFPKIESILPDKEETIILYCSSGNRSKRVQEKMNNLGYINVYNLEGGLEGY